MEKVMIAFSGVDKRSRLAYQQFFESNKRVNLQTVDDYRDAQLCIIDRDSHKVRKLYEDLLNNYPEKYILSISIIKQNCAHKNELYLQKPIKREQLQAIIVKLYRLIVSHSRSSPGWLNSVSALFGKAHTPKNSVARVSASPPVVAGSDDNVVAIKAAQSPTVDTITNPVKIENEEYYVGERADIDITSLEQLKTIFYSPAGLLQGIVETACEKSAQTQRIVHLNILKHDFYFDDSAQKIYTTAGSAVIRPLCVMPHQEDPSYNVKHINFRKDLRAILKKSRDGISRKSLQRQIWSMDSFKWTIALWCSRGRIPAGLDITQPVYLRRWPNLPRVEVIPYALQIAALLYEQPRSLIDTANQLGIAQRYVFAFFSACRAIGLSDVSRREVDRLFVPEQARLNKNKAVLIGLLGKLSACSSKPSLSKATK